MEPNPTKLEISGGLLARNSLINLFGLAVPLIVGVITIPFIVRGLGVERFGLLSLAWVVLGYFTIFDLGLGRATTKYVAEALGRGEENKLPNLVWTAVTVQALLGFLGAVVLASITPLLAEHILNIPAGLIKEAKNTFYLLALSIPMILVSSSFSGVLEAAQRFDIVNVVRIPTSITTYLLPVIGVHLGLGLTGIVALILISRFLGLSALMTLTFYFLPVLQNISPASRLFPLLLRYGGWLTASNAVIPVFVYLDRFFIGSLLTISAVGYYTPPYEFASRLLIIPASMASVLFPAFSSISQSKSREDLSFWVARSLKYVLTAMAPLTVLCLIFAEDILGIWLGSDFVVRSVDVFRLLSVAVLLNSIGYIPFVLIQAIGRPDVIAKYHFIELPVYVGVSLLLINQLGISGAALAWCLRMAWTIPIFFLLCIKIAHVPFKALSENGANRSLIVSGGLLAASIIFVMWSIRNVIVNITLTVTLLAGYALTVWCFIFDHVDRDPVRKLIRGQIRNIQRTGAK